MTLFRADLHIHTALSPCANDDMLPADIIARAQGKGLDLIAICDHNRAEAVPAVQSIPSSICVLAGIEITTIEGVHVLGLFPDAVLAQQAASELGRHLPPRTHVSSAHSRDELFGLEATTQDYSARSTLSVENVSRLIRTHLGLVIAAHVDRPFGGHLALLGHLPRALFDAVELSPVGAKNDALLASLPWTGPRVFSSDAHFLHDIGSVHSDLAIPEASFSAVKAYFHDFGARGSCHA